MPTVVEPNPGALFYRAAETDAGGKKRRQLLLLLAAYADAGEHSPPMAALSAQLAMAPRKIDLLLDALVAAQLIEVRWGCPGKRRRPGKRGAGRLNRYTLLTDNWGRAGEEAAP